MGKTNVAPKDLGVPVYPGASQEGNITMTGSDNAEKKSNLQFL